jgi:hypothetical protein
MIAAEGEAPEDDNEIAKASEAHFEIMDLFKEGSDFKGCKDTEFLIH